MAKQLRSRPNQILTQTLLQASDEVRANIENIRTCKRDLQRQRRGSLPKDRATLQELTIPVEWTDTVWWSRLTLILCQLLWPCTAPACDSVWYAAEEQPRHLGQSDAWFMDGNYTMSPSGQLCYSCSSRRVCSFLCMCLPFWKECADLPRAASSSCGQDVNRAGLARSPRCYHRLWISSYSVSALCAWTSSDNTGVLWLSVSKYVEEDPGAGEDVNCTAPTTTSGTPAGCLMGWAFRRQGEEGHSVFDGAHTDELEDLID